MKINKLKIAGFKSFADRVEIPVSDGVTGIVGPNGCGKSNLIEALRWAMGETSAKRMRADGMDDVIFGGTDLRPPRSSCEVVISIDNSERKAPAEFNDSDLLDVSRRLDRGDGSSYRLNGKSVRARDVQVLYKDAGVGAGSSALVSQGKVGAIINSKPSERRNILEEAAGTAGLASRRHEAELRLRGTEQNLERAEDQERGLSDQLSSLRRQARQARRHKEIDGLVRAAEAAAFLVRWTTASTKALSFSGSFDENEANVKALILDLQAAEKGLSEAEEKASPAVQARVDAETMLALAKARVENVRKEIQAAKNALSSAQKAVERAEKDIQRERDAIGQSGEEYEELKDRRLMAEDDQSYDSVLIEEAAEKVVEAKDELDGVSEEVQVLTSELATKRAERDGVIARQSDARSRFEATKAKLLDAQKKLSEVQEALSSLPGSEFDISGLESAFEVSENALEEAENALTAAREREVQCQNESGEFKTELVAIRVELDALKSLKKAETGRLAGGEARPSKGYEKAVASVLEDGYSAALGSGEQRWWESDGVKVEPPKGLMALLDQVDIPDELISLFSGVGFVEEVEDEASVMKLLQPGQAVVTRGGFLIRWDGYRTIGSEAAEADVRTAQRIEELEQAFVGAEERQRAADVALGDAKAKVLECKSVFENARTALKQSRETLEKERIKAQAAEKERYELEVRVTGLREGVAALMEASSQDEASCIEAAAAVEKLNDISHEEARLHELRERMSHLSRTYETNRDALDKVKRDAEARILLLANIDQQLADFDKRLVRSRDLVVELEERREEMIQEVSRLAEADILSEGAEEEAHEALVEAAEAHGAAMDAARESEELVSSLREAVRDRGAKLGEAKEERARLLAEMKASAEMQQEIERGIVERLDCQPEALWDLSGISKGDDLPDLSACESRVQRLTRERDNIGSVNLLAEQQVEEVEAKLGEANKARGELREAVRRLRSTIEEFDREARVRLTEAFSQIDGHFRDLFSRLFGGGHAYLKLSGSEDILESGLEIYASPPGKKLQTMSLLSGGEQALAALALIFAAFMIRPAPVCVLDEVDAPLDDANVERMCALIHEMAKDSTRFLVVTHHALTMARCDRLYGVTMMEKGVSKLASVDMESAVEFLSV